MTFARPTPEQHRERNAARREANLRALCNPVRNPRGSYGGTTTGCVPKTKPKRNPALLGMAMGKPCLLAIPLVCTGNTATTVACHSNLSIHGKAGARKAEDCYSVWGCSACHTWLDQGPAPADEKAQAFTRAHIAQVQEWRKTAGDAGETPRHRRAAQWALDQLNEATA